MKIKLFALTTLLAFTNAQSSEQTKTSQKVSNFRKISDYIHNLTTAELTLIIGINYLPLYLSNNYYTTKYLIADIKRECRSYNPDGYTLLKRYLDAFGVHNARLIIAPAISAFIIKKVNTYLRKRAKIEDTKRTSGTPDETDIIA